MEMLQILEQKIAQLIAVVKELQAEITTLKSDNALLREKNMVLAKDLDSAQTSVLADQAILDEEKSLAKLAVDEMIKNIDSLVNSQNQL